MILAVGLARALEEPATNAIAGLVPCGELLAVDPLLHLVPRFVHRLVALVEVEHVERATELAPEGIRLLMCTMHVIVAPAPTEIARLVVTTVVRVRAVREEIADRLRDV